MPAPYTTTAAITARLDARTLAQLAGDPPDAGLLAAAVDDADAIIDGYLGKVAEAARPADATLEPRAIDIAIYRLTAGRPGQEFEAVRARYDDALKWLQATVDEYLKATSGGGGDDGGSGLPGTTGGAVTWSAPTKSFGDGGLDGFV